MDEKIQDIAQENLEKNQTIDQFGVSQTPFHTHNGSDSPQLNEANLVNRSLTIPLYLPGTSPATAGNYGQFFVAPFKCIFGGASEVHAVLGTDGSAVTLQIEKLTGTTASGSGTSLLSAGFNLKGTINTVQNGVLARVAKSTFSLNKGDRLGLALTGTPTAVAGLAVTIQLSF